MHPPAAARTADPVLLRVLAVLALLVIVISFLFLPGALPTVDICHFKRLTGLPCPGCGLSHAFCAISHGQFAAAWHYNPFSFFVYLGALLVIPGPLLVHYAPQTARFYQSRATFWIIAALGTSMLVWGIARMWQAGQW